jgi:hypothetical protein
MRLGFDLEWRIGRPRVGSNRKVVGHHGALAAARAERAGECREKRGLARAVGAHEGTDSGFAERHLGPFRSEAARITNAQPLEPHRFSPKKRVRNPATGRRNPATGRHTEASRTSSDGQPEAGAARRSGSGRAKRTLRERRLARARSRALRAGSARGPRGRRRRRARGRGRRARARWRASRAGAKLGELDGRRVLVGPEQAAGGDQPLGAAAFGAARAGSRRRRPPAGPRAGGAPRGRRGRAGPRTGGAARRRPRSTGRPGRGAVRPRPGSRSGRDGDEQEVDPPVQQKLADHEPGLDRLAEADIVGEQQIDPRRLERLGQGLELVGLEAGVRARGGERAEPERPARSAGRSLNDPLTFSCQVRARERVRGCSWPHFSSGLSGFSRRSLAGWTARARVRGSAPPSPRDGLRAAALATRPCPSRSGRPCRSPLQDPAGRTHRAAPGPTGTTRPPTDRAPAPTRPDRSGA